MAGEDAAGFEMAIKASRYLTHVRRLREPAEPVARLLAAAAGLRRPAGTGAAAAAAEPAGRSARAGRLPGPVRPPVRAASRCAQPRWPGMRGIPPSVLADRRGPIDPCAAQRRDVLVRPAGPAARTAVANCRLGYLRLHEGAAQPWPRYGRQSLQSWMRRIAALPPEADVFAFFNNDQHAAAPADAAALAGLADRAGGSTPPRLSGR